MARYAVDVPLLEECSGHNTKLFSGRSLASVVLVAQGKPHLIGPKTGLDARTTTAF